MCQFITGADSKNIFDAWTIPEKLEDWFLGQACFKTEEDAPRSPDKRIKIQLPHAVYRWTDLLSGKFKVDT